MKSHISLIRGLQGVGVACAIALATLPALAGENDDYPTITEPMAQMLAGQCYGLLDNDPSPNRVYSALRSLSQLCGRVTPEIAQPIREKSLSYAAKGSADSDRVRRLLTGGFMPTFEGLTTEQAHAELLAYDETLDAILENAQKDQLRADLLYAKARPRIEMNETRDVAWLDETQRALAINAMKEVASKYGDIESPQRPERASYAEMARKAIHELEALRFRGEPLDLRGVDLDGQERSLRRERGKIVVLTFWSTFCAPCLASVPHEKAMIQRFESDPFVFIGVNTDAQKASARTVARQRSMPWVNIWDPPGQREDSFANYLDVVTLPSVFVLDAQGRLRYKFKQTSYRETFTTDDVRKAVEALLQEMREGSEGEA